MSRMKIMAANALKLAATAYTDSTGFISILQENDLNDILINAPVAANLLAAQQIGDRQIVIPPSEGFQVNWMLSFEGIDGSYTVTNIQQVYSIPGGPPFCSCDANRVLPPTGVRVSTVVSVAPDLMTDLVIGQPVVIFVAEPNIINVPRTLLPTLRGIVS